MNEMQPAQESPTRPIYDLNPVWMRQSLLQIAIEGAQQALDAARAELARDSAEKKSEIIAALAVGMSTGDPLQDNILTYFGPNRPILDAVLTFNQRLQNAAGKEILFVCEYSVRLRHGGTIRPEDLVTEHGYILGTLSGQPLRFEMTEDKKWALTLPLVHSVSWNFDRFGADRKLQRKEGSLTIDRIFGEPSLLSTLKAITHEEPVPADHSADFIPAGTKVTFLIGEEIGDTHPIDKARAILGAATPAEQLQGAHI